MGKTLPISFSFSEVTTGLKKDKTYDTETIPIGLKKNIDFGLKNTILEVDLADDNCDWSKFTIENMCELIHQRSKCIYEKFSDARIVINLRDFPTTMAKYPDRAMTVIKFLARLPKNEQFFAVAFEDAGGDYLPVQLEAWTASARRMMDANGWKNGKLIVHIHQRWDLHTAATLNCLSVGADGVWASVCEEGAAVGHACSTVTMMNLVRLGNKKVLDKYNCTNFRNAAIEVTKVTTGKPPYPKQVIYGSRALDFVFMGDGNFDMAEFFGVKAPNRISTLATEEMIIERLTNLFEKDDQFTKEIAKEMKKLMIQDLDAGRKEEYMSEFGLAVLFDRAGGKMTEKMCNVMKDIEVHNLRHQELIAEIREEWNRWDVRDEIKGDDCLEYDSFYHGFLAPYFSCYRCSKTKNALRGLDMDKDGLIDWKEFMVYIKWALHQYPKVENADDLLTIVFERGLIPAMYDEQKKKNLVK